MSTWQNFVPIHIPCTPVRSPARNYELPSSIFMRNAPETHISINFAPLRLVNSSGLWIIILISSKQAVAELQASVYNQPPACTPGCRQRTQVLNISNCRSLQGWPSANITQCVTLWRSTLATVQRHLDTGHYSKYRCALQESQMSSVSKALRWSPYNLWSCDQMTIWPLVMVWRQYMANRGTNTKTAQAYTLPCFKELVLTFTFFHSCRYT